MILRTKWVTIVLGISILSCTPMIEPAATDTQPAPIKEHVVAFYFHGAIRCVTCLDIEQVARETVETGFLDAIARGDLEWRSVDYDADGNAHFKDDYELSMPSLVLVRFRGDAVVRWLNLEETWTHVGEGEDALPHYVETELRAFLATAA